MTGRAQRGDPRLAAPARLPHFLCRENPAIQVSQFSLHDAEQESAMAHHQILRAGGTDPSRQCAGALVVQIPKNATVIVYNASFEMRVLRDLARDVPELMANCST